MTNKLMKDNRRYWQSRLDEAEKQREKRDERLEDATRRIYRKAYKDVQKEIDAFYGRFQKRTGLDRQAINQIASDFDIQAFEDRAREYVENRDFSERANSELMFYNFKMRVNQLELLKANLDLTIIEAGAENEKLIEKDKIEELKRTLKEHAGILGLSTPSDERMNQMIQAMVHKPYYGAEFSERIWDEHINPLRKYLDSAVTRTIVTGQSPERLARDLKKRFKVTTSNARRLAVTEVGFMETEGQKISYQDAGFDRYGIQPEAGVCNICQSVIDECEAQGGFPVSAMNPGLNAPLFHPWCRCGTYPIVDREALDELLEEN